MSNSFNRFGLTTGYALVLTGVGMLCVAFALAGYTFVTYLTQSDFASPSTAGLPVNLNTLVNAVVIVMILGIMGWLGSILLLRGLDFAKYERQLAAEKRVEPLENIATPETEVAAPPIVNAASTTIDSATGNESSGRSNRRKRLSFTQTK